MARHSSRAPYYIILTLMFLAGAMLRLWHLPERGLHTHDEGRFLIVADSYLDAAGAVLGGKKLNDLSVELRQRGGSFFAHAKEGHVFLLAAWRMIFGRSVGMSALLSVLLSLGATLLLYRLVSDWAHHPGPAVVAAGALLLSPLFLHYSRSVLSEAGSLIFIIVSLGMAHRACVNVQHGRPFSKVKKRALMAGIMAGIAITLHYNKLWALALAAAMWIFMIFQSHRSLRKDLWKALGMIAAGFVIPLIAIQAITRIVAWKAGAAYPEYKTYIGDLWYHFTEFHAGGAGGAAESRSSGGGRVLYGLELLIAWRGYAGAALMLATLAAGCVMAVKRNEDWLLRAALVMLIVPFVFFSFYSFQVERSFVGIEAAWAVVVGLVWWRVAERAFRLKMRRLLDPRHKHSQFRPTLAAASLCAVMFVVTFPFGVRVVRNDASPFGAAARALAPMMIERGGRVTAGSVTWHARPQWIVYLNSELNAKIGDGVSLEKYVDWSANDTGDYVLIENFEYADSPIFPPELTTGLEPVIDIPSGSLTPMMFTPGVKVYDLRK